MTGKRSARLQLSSTGPANLQQLVPEYCAAVSTDPFDGRTLRYRTDGASYAVYSIGSDRRDDGEVAWGSSYTKVPLDVGLIVGH